MATIQQALANVAIDIGAIGKNQINQTQKFKFRGIDDVLSAVHDPLTKHGVVPLPIVKEIHQTSERSTRNGGVMLHILASVTIRFIGPEGDSLETTVLAEALDSSDKAAAKLMSMAYKYAMFQVLSIPVEGGLVDGDTESPPREPRHQPKKMTVQELHKSLSDSADKAGTDVEAITAKWRARNGELSIEEFLKLPAEKIQPLVTQIAAYVGGNK